MRSIRAGIIVTLAPNQVYVLDHTATLNISTRGSIISVTAATELKTDAMMMKWKEGNTKVAKYYNAGTAIVEKDLKDGFFPCLH